MSLRYDVVNEPRRRDQAEKYSTPKDDAKGGQLLFTSVATESFSGT